MYKAGRKLPSKVRIYITEENIGSILLYVHFSRSEFYQSWCIELMVLEILDIV